MKEIIWSDCLQDRENHHEYDFNTLQRTSPTEAFDILWKFQEILPKILVVTFKILFLRIGSGLFYKRLEKKEQSTHLRRLQEPRGGKSSPDYGE